MRVGRSRLRGVFLTVALCAAGPGTALTATAQEVTAQEVTPTVREPTATPIRDEAERIGQERWAIGLPDSALREGVQSDGTTFRLNISAPQVNLRAPWLDDDDPRPTRRPTGGSIYHEEMLRQTVPEEFRASTFNPVGVGIDPAVIVNGIRGAWRDWQVRRIRAQIARELEDLAAANAAAR